MVVFKIDDRGIYTKLEITNNKKVIVRKKFNNMSEALLYILNKSKNIKTEEMIEELLVMEDFLKDSQFKFKENV